MASFFQYRATGAENMDDFSLSGQQLTDTLDDLARVNRWLGGHAIVRSGMKQIIEQLVLPTPHTLRVADLGCGGGETLRMLAAWAQKASIPILLTGIDANAATISYAREAARDFPEIDYLQANAMDESCPFDDYDVVICSLFLHHLEEPEQVRLLRNVMQAGVKAILINDLQRSVLAWLLFYPVSRILGLSPLSRHDGALSVRKSFHRNELAGLMKKCGIHTFSINWKWAFRYQLIAFIP